MKVAALAPPIDEAVGLLAHAAPQSLTELRRRFPDPADADLLRVGIIAGETDRRMNLRLEVSLEALRVADRGCANKILELRSRLERSNRVELTGQIMTVIGGAAVVGTLAQDLPRVTTYLGGAISLLAGVMPPIAQHLRKGPDEKGTGVAEGFRKLVELRTKAQQLTRELNRWLGSDTDPELIPSELVNEVNVLCAEVSAAVALS